MPEHLTENQIEDYGRRKLPAAELLSVSDHLEMCEACRGQVEKVLGSDTAFFSVRSEVFGPAAGILSTTEVWTHPTTDQIAEYVDGMATGEELQVITDHLSNCEQCAMATDNLRAFKSQVTSRLGREYRPRPVRAESESWGRRLLAFLPQPLQRAPLAFSSALVVLLLIVIGWFVWQRRQEGETKTELVRSEPSSTVTPQPNPTVIPTVSPEARAAPVIAQLNDGEGRITLDQEGKLSGVDNLPPAYQRMVKETLTNQRLVKSPMLAGLSRPGSSLMGGDQQGNNFSLIAPVGKVIISDRPTLRWSPLEGATGYVIEVYDEGFNLAAASPQLTGNSWVASQPLKRGAIYSWQVKAIKDGQEFKSPRPPAPQAKFRVLDQGRLNEIEQAQRAYATSHLTLGLLYAQAGLLDEAEQQFRALKKSNPDSTLVQKLLSQINRMRH